MTNDIIGHIMNAGYTVFLLTVMAVSSEAQTLGRDLPAEQAAIRSVVCLNSSARRQAYQHITNGWYLDAKCRLLTTRQHDRFTLYYTEITSAIKGCKADALAELHNMQKSAFATADDQALKCNKKVENIIRSAYISAHELYADMRHARYLASRQQ